MTLAANGRLQVESSGILTVSGAIGGPGRLLIGSPPNLAGLVVMHAANTYGGGTDITGGTLRLGSNGRLPDGGTVTVDALFDLNGVNDTIGGLAGGGAVSLGFGNLTIGGAASTTFGGILTGSGGLVKNGTGTLTLEGANLHTGPTTVNQGRLLINGAQQSSPVVVNGGILGGVFGQMGSLTANAGQVSPGASPGVLFAAGGVTLGASSVFRVEIDGTQKFSDYDQLVLAGPLSIADATLIVSVGFAPAPGTSFTILDKLSAGPVTGTFAGLPEGGTVQAGSVALRISYAGGDGNDVTLTFLTVKTYLSEGAVNDFFDTQLALINPSATSAANVTLRFLKSDVTTVTSSLAVPALTRRTVNVKDVPNMNPAEFSTVVESDVPVIAERTMTWGANAYGSHAETGVDSPGTRWFLAEGATHSGFNLFYLIQNADTSAADVEVTYLLPAPAPPVIKTYQVAPNSRFNIWVNLEDAALAATDISAALRVTNGVPIIVERAMYLDGLAGLFAAGHESAGVKAPALSWFLAEGATGAYFDLFVLIANPGLSDADVTVTFLLPSGATVVRNYTISARSRFNIWVDLEDPQLADTQVSTTVSSTNGIPVVVEHAMWWPGEPATWHEAHNSAGATTTGTQWALAEGEEGGIRNLETYILIANTSSFLGTAQVTLLFEDGTTAGKLFALNPTSRLNVSVRAEFPVALGRRFGAIVQSLGATPAQLVVERAMYSDALGVHWAAGTNALASKLQ
jgi:autotransporter-associated beta strand protein